jgi:eukaryotic-like serine/threonine-protein kinase
VSWLSDGKIKHLLNVTSEPDFSSTKYLLVEQIGRGGMASVYLAQDTELGREIAIKVLNMPEMTSEIAQRMIREARIISRLEHPGIVPVHDVGVIEDGRVFYAMKLVRGNRLDEYAAQNASVKDRLRKFQSACEAVAFAHAHGVIHRDLKPQNIMIGEFGEVLVLDWGVAKILDLSHSSESALRCIISSKVERDFATISKPQFDEDTAHGTIIGTPLYMSPEQTRGEIAQLDERSDVYSLGAILYLLLTNRLPDPAGDYGPSVSPRPREVNARVSKPAEAICLKAMAQVKVERYRSAKELAADVTNLIDDQPVSAYRENAFERIGRWLGRNRFLVFLILAYLLMRVFFILTTRR